MWVAMNKPLFKRAAAEFGALELGEVFAFTPPLAASPGVVPRDPLSWMARVPAYDALNAAAHVAPLTLVQRVLGQINPVRTVGVDAQ